jgi:HNH endonuclease
MSVVSEATRQAVVIRAQERCEYCHLPMRGQVATFPIDHVRPRSSDGPTILDNLALACPHCNACKWKHANGVDPASGEVTRLFNPRTDAWAEHFGWDVAGNEQGMLLGKTGIGRATITRLQMNAQDMIQIRQLLAALGVFQEQGPQVP